jgi:hypothetical protein
VSLTQLVQPCRMSTAAGSGKRRLSAVALAGDWVDGAGALHLSLHGSVAASGVPSAAVNVQEVSLDLCPVAFCSLMTAAGTMSTSSGGEAVRGASRVVADETAALLFVRVPSAAKVRGRKGEA